MISAHVVRERPLTSACAGESHYRHGIMRCGKDSALSAFAKGCDLEFFGPTAVHQSPSDAVNFAR
jgi:hypothetical protein